MSKFDEYFSEVQAFSDGTHVLSGSFSIEEAAEMFSEYTGDRVSEEGIGADRVRFGFAPETVEDMSGRLCWYTGAGNGKGTRPVWCIG